VEEAVNPLTIVLAEVAPVVMVACCEPYLVATIVHFLSPAFQVYAALTSAEALSLYGQHRDDIDLVLINLSMPPLNGGGLSLKGGGLAVFDARRQIDPTVRCAFMSGGFCDDVIAHVMERGAVGCISKPFSRDELAKRLRELSLR
jgi:two-component system, cell cycle sensor histidine kinase and response regulator CckA